MATPKAARKNSPPPAKPKAKKSTTAARKKNGTCSACGFTASEGHANQCPNSRCGECSMMGGNHGLSCSQHPNHVPVIDGKDGSVIDITVDGKTARVKVTKPAPDVEDEKKPKGITRVAPPLLEDTRCIARLQEALDKKLVFGIKQPLTTSTTCEHEWYDKTLDQPVGCNAAAAFDFESSNTCPTCQKTTKAKRDKLCVVHMSLRVDDELEDMQTEMEFEE